MGLENTAVLSLGYLLKLEAILLIVLCGEGSNFFCGGRWGVRCWASVTSGVAGPPG